MDAWSGTLCHDEFSEIGIYSSQLPYSDDFIKGMYSLSLAFSISTMNNACYLVSMMTFREEGENLVCYIDAIRRTRRILRRSRNRGFLSFERRECCDAARDDQDHVSRNVTYVIARRTEDD